MTTGQRRSQMSIAPALMILLMTAVNAFAGSVTPRVDLDHRAVLAHDDVVVYALIDFDVADAPHDRDAPRPRLNLALVLDRSGSMDERGKMVYARDAAKMMIDMLGPGDRLAVVEYDDEVTVLWPSSFVDSPGPIKRRIDGLEPRGSTDLFGGLMGGADEVLPHRDGCDITRVVLLSDGLANRGLTDQREIVRRVRRLGEQGVSVTTLGLGLEYNEDLMEAIAGAAGGNYAFIENPRTMGRIFADELHTLTTTVARDVAVDYEPAGCVTDVQVYGYETRDRRHGLHIPMEDIYAGETRSLLLRLEIDTGRPGRLELGNLRLSYVDMLEDRTVEEDLPLSVRVTDDRHQMEISRNDRVTVEANLIDADRRLDGIVRMYDKGDRILATEALKTLNDDIIALNSSVPDVKLSAKLEDLAIQQQDMDAAADDSRAAESYVKQQKANIRLSNKGKQQHFMLTDKDRGPEVVRLQEALHTAGVYDGPMDGVFSDEVGAAIKEFQKQRGLTVDGMAGPKTQRELKLR